MSVTPSRDDRDGQDDNDGQDGQDGLICNCSECFSRPVGGICVCLSESIRDSSAAPSPDGQDGQDGKDGQDDQDGQDDLNEFESMYRLDS